MIWLVGARRQRGERLGGAPTDGGGDRARARPRHVQQVAGLGIDHQPVARPERCGQRRVDGDAAVAAEHDHLAGLERAERLRPAAVLAAFMAWSVRSGM